MEPNTTARPSRAREGIEITLESAAGDPTVTDAWVVAGWVLRFMRLGPDQAVELEPPSGTSHVKVITGCLTTPDRGAFGAAQPTARAIRATRIDATQIQAGSDGAVVAIMTRTDAVPDAIHSMDQLTFSGPLAEHFRWQSFEDKFGQFLDAFNGADAYIVPGFHLLDDDGTEIAYVHFWTAGKGVDLTTHNHGQDPSPAAPAFAEVHWVFSNGTGAGAMYETSHPGAESRTRYPMQTGQEHGAFFQLENGRPKRLPNGAVDYPWHGWQAGDDGIPDQAYDFVAAFEINPDYVEVTDDD